MASLVAKSAFTMLREQQPANWKVYLQEAKNAIQLKRRYMKLGDTPQETANALYQCILSGKMMPTYLLAAAYLIDNLRKLKDDHIRLEQQSLKTFEHIQKLEQLPWSGRNIEACRSYYLGWMRRYEKDIDKILEEIRVLERDFKGNAAPSALPPKYPGIFRA